MKTYIQIFSMLILLVSCSNKISQVSKTEENTKTINSSIQEKIANLKNSHNKEVIVVAHRADWRNAPENSLQAIQSCIAMGVDMIEIDISETKDGQLVLMHDKSINRTTNGVGLVKDWTLESLKEFRLKDGLGVVTQNSIPTLREALLLAKGKILVNLDKSYEIFDKCYEIVKETDTQNQVIIKGAKSKSVVQKEFGKYLDKVFFMPIIKLENPDAMRTITEYMSENPPVAIEFTVKYDTLQGIQRFNELREKGTSVWVNSLWPQHNGGHDDEKAAIDPSIYDWYIKNHVDIIQTDRPKILIEYLRSKGLHH